MEDFELWWNTIGRFYDPDTEDVPWFDKRKELAALAFEAGKDMEAGQFPETTSGDPYEDFPGHVGTI